MYIDSIGFDLDNPLEGKKDKIIEYFVKFYGEKYRNTITEKINDCHVYSLATMNDYEMQLLKQHFQELKDNTKSLPEKERKAATQKYDEDFQKIIDYYANKPYVKVLQSSPSFREYLLEFLVNQFNIPKDKQEKIENTFLPQFSLYIMFESNKKTKIKRSKQLSKELGELLFDGKKIPRTFLVQAQKIFLNRSEIENEIEIKLNQNEILLGKIIDEDLLKDLPRQFHDFYTLHTLVQSYLDGNVPSYVSAETLSSHIDGQENRTICAVLFLATFLINSGIVVHELNHVISSRNVKRDNILYSKRGIKEMELIDGEVQVNERDFIDSVQTNEIITDYFAHKIVEDMQKDGFNISLVSRQETIYSSMFPLYKDFIENNIETIKECYLGDDANKLNNFIGERNFKELCGFTNLMKLYCATCDFREVPFLKENGYNLHDVDVKKVLALKPKDEELDNKSRTYFTLLEKGKEIFDNIDRYIRGKVDRQEDNKIYTEEDKQPDFKELIWDEM